MSGDSRGFRSRRRWTPVAVIIVAWIGTTSAYAQRASGWIDLSANRSDLQTVAIGGDVRQDDRFGFQQRYRLDLTWQVYGNFRLTLGGQFERLDTTDLADRTAPDVTQERIQPYFNLRLGNRITSAQIDIIRFQNKSETGISSSDDIQDNYTALLGWRPELYPTVRLRLQRQDSHDAQRISTNSIRDIAELTSIYNLKDKARLYYRGALESFDDRINGNESRRNAQFGEITYGDHYWHGRAQFNAEYSLSYQETRFTTGGSGEIITPVEAEAGLSTISDTPTDVVLDDNPALIDANLIASAGINLGTASPGGDDRPREIGLDFGLPTTIDTLRVWVDRELPPLISAWYSWEIYTSSDNLNWQFSGVVSPADFGPFETRFELRFGEITARYVKVVTRPLDPTVPGSDGFPDIFVTELQSFRRIPGSTASTTNSTVNQRGLTNLQLRLLENQPLLYDFSLVGRKTDDSSYLYTMTNGLTYNKQLSPVYRISTRIAREDTRQTNDSIIAYPWSVSLRASALPTVQHTLVFSGRFGEINDQSGRDSSVFLYNNARLYRGVQVNLNAGTAVRKQDTGQVSTNDQLLLGATLRPHRTVNVVLQYQLRKSESAGGGLPTVVRDQTLSRITVAYIPVRAIYINASYRLNRVTAADDLITRNYGISWRPFAGGSLQLTFRYNDTFRTLLNQSFRVYSARARWNITPRWFVELAYEDARTESDLTVSDRDSIRGNTLFRF